MPGVVTALVPHHPLQTTTQRSVAVPLPHRPLGAISARSQALRAPSGHGAQRCDADRRSTLLGTLPDIWDQSSPGASMARKCTACRRSVGRERNACESLRGTTDVGQGSVHRCERERVRPAEVRVIAETSASSKLIPAGLKEVTRTVRERGPIITALNSALSDPEVTRLIVVAGRELPDAFCAAVISR